MAEKNNTIARRLEVKGIVQGVGFRPFVYQLANRCEIKGQVGNTPSGVSIHIEGLPEDIESFCSHLTEKAPPLACITDISVHSVSLNHSTTFSIVKSVRNTAVSTLISPDISICEDCLQELFNPEDRRYQYPFINCTNCGPRYTIIDKIPYDRPNTSMKHFKMCRTCLAEYENPEDRRFHAQPSACARCGPRVTLYDHSRQRILAENAIEEAAKRLNSGYIVAIKGLGGFHLAADAENHDAVSRLRKRKQREEKPFALMSESIKDICRYAVVQPEEELLLLSPQRPIVILKKKRPNTISEDVSPRNENFGVMLPYTPLHYLLLNRGFTALVMTSGNMTEEPIAFENEEAFDRLSKTADYFLMHNRDIYLRSDDSIVKRTANVTRLLRRSRGYVPNPIFLRQDLPQVLACGAELKNTVCLTKENKAFLSQHIGDLENVSAFDFFCTTIEHMKRILHMKPEIIAYDLHPDYLSTRYARGSQHLHTVPVQHHHAHIVSCMAENRLQGPVIGLSFDGAGLGIDGNIWGGEILIADEKNFSRNAHIAYIPMPGSTAAIKEPWRMAVSYLYDALGDSFRDLNLPITREIGEKNVNIILEMISKRVNCPHTSSLGRLFDGVCSLIGIRHTARHEGQAAMELEMIASEETKKIYDYEWTKGNPHLIFPKPIIRGIVEDIRKGVAPSHVSARFHWTLIHLLSRLCTVIRAETGINRVALSGGVFQNDIMMTGLTQDLEENRFQVFSHHLVPTNDGGIALGQAVVAAAHWQA